MKLWLLKQLQGAYWNETAGLVVRAETESAARALANKCGDPYNPEQDTYCLCGKGAHYGQEGRIWEDPDRTSCIELVADGPAEIVLIDFNAA
jgi:hypothetical protein